MARMSTNAGSLRRNDGDSLKMTSWFLDSGASCQMTPKTQDFIQGSLVEIDEYIKVSDEHFITAKQTGESQIEMYDNNGKPFIAMFYFPLLC